VNVAVGFGVIAGVPVGVTVKVYVPAVVPGFPPPPPPLLPPPPQAAMLPIARNIRSIPNIARHPRLRAGTPRKTSKARTAVLPVSTQRFICGFAKEAEVAAVVLTVAVAVPLVVEALRATGEPVTLHVGAFVAPAGELVRVHATLTEPTYPFVPVIVIVDEAELPFAIEEGLGAEAEIVKPTCVTVTSLLPAAAAYVASPL